MSFRKQNKNRISVRPLVSLLGNKKNLVVAELGVFEGDSTIEMLSRCNIKKYYAVDLWEAYPEYNERGWGLHKRFNPKFKDVVYKAFVERIKNYPQVEIIREYTNLAHLHIKDGELDFCFIDANHDYEYVYEDIKLWLSKIKKGGILCGDDYQMASVRNAVNNFFKDTEYSIHTKRGSWWIIK